MPDFLINGRTPAALGLRMGRRELASFATSRVILEIADATLAAAVALVQGTVVTITRNGAAFFNGKVRAIGRNGRGQTIEIRDAWEELEQHQVTQAWNGKSTNALFLGAGADGGRFDATVAPEPNVTVAEELQRTIQSAITAGVGVSLGSIEGSTKLWAYQQSNRSAAEILRDVTALQPNAVSYFSYATNAINIKTSHGSVTIPLTAVAGASISPREDMLVDGVEIAFEHYSGGVRVDSEIQAAGGSGRMLRATLGMQGVGQWGTAYGQSPVPDGLAASLRDSYGQRYYEGEITLTDEAYGGTQWMGSRINLSGGPAEWASMAAQVIGVSEDFGSGTITIKVGPAPQADNPNRALRNKPPVAPSAPPTVVASPPASETHGPLETYVAANTNSVVVAPGLCGQDIANQDVDVTGTDVGIATIGTGGQVDVWLGVSIQPAALPFTVIAGGGAKTTEYLIVGTGNVLTATIQLNTVSPAAQPCIVNAATGAVVQNAVVYFKLATVTWPSGPAPSVHIYRQGNLDVLLIPPNRVYLTAME